MSQEGWRIGPGRAMDPAGGGHCGHPVPLLPHGASHACMSQLLNLTQPQSSFETPAKPRGYADAGGGRESIPTLSFGLSCCLGWGERLWHPPDSTFIHTFPVSPPKAAQQQL